eukprot:s7028_g1.t1
MDLVLQLRRALRWPLNHPPQHLVLMKPMRPATHCLAQTLPVMTRALGTSEGWSLLNARDTAVLMGILLLLAFEFSTCPLCRVDGWCRRGELHQTMPVQTFCTSK